MLPAINRGVGGTLAFPDVCMTPMVPSPVPIPYPNLGFTAMSVPFSPKVMLSMVNAINMATGLNLTTGDEGGVAHPTIKGMARYSMGNPVVMIHMLPGIMLCALSTGNNFNAPLGANLIPSVTNVFFTRRSEPVDVDEGPPLAREDGGAIRVREFTTDVGSRMWSLMRDHGAEAGLCLDLRGCPGGVVDAALQLADDFLPDGVVLAQRIDEEGDGVAVRGRRRQAYVMPLAVLVDGATASAAEIFAAALQCHGRARVFGATTYGKATAARLVGAPEGGRMAPGGFFARPDGAPIDGCGVAPDVATDDPEREAATWLATFR
ncbi:MAG: S41 family peptidase [Myxococcota bacterium]